MARSRRRSAPSNSSNAKPTQKKKASSNKTKRSKRANASSSSRKAEQLRHKPKAKPKSKHSAPTKKRTKAKNKLSIYTDASAWGIGLVTGGKWNHWKWTAKTIPSQWRGDDGSTQREALAVEAGVRVMLRGVKPGDKTITVYCDNDGVRHAWKKGTSKITWMKKWIKRIKNLLNGHKLVLKRVSGKENPADGPSRGKKGSGQKMTGKKLF